VVCLTIGEGSTIDMEDLKGLQEDVYYFMILSFKELLYNSPTSHPLGNSQIFNLAFSLPQLSLFPFAFSLKKGIFGQGEENAQRRLEIHKQHCNQRLPK